MNTALLAVAIAAVALLAYAIALWQAERARRRWFEGVAAEKEAMLRDGLREQAGRHREEIVTLIDTHTAEIERLTKAHAEERAVWQAEVKSLASMMQAAVGVAAFGGAPRPATVQPQPPDAEARMQRRIKEETIQAGVAAIKADYAQAGIPITDEEARAQAIAFLNGDTIPLPGGGT